MRLFSKLTTIKAIFLIIIAGFVVFGNALFNQFVWDDIAAIVNNPEIHTFNPVQYFGQSKYTDAGSYRPLHALYNATLYALFGAQAFSYHFFQVSLHIVNTILLYLFFKTLFNHFDTDYKKAQEEKWHALSGSQKVKLQRQLGYKEKTSSFLTHNTNSLLSLIISVLFLIHPINVESVSYIAASQSGLFFLFGILALFISLKEKIALNDIILISCLLLFSILSKETGVLFILVILFFQILFIKGKNISIFFAGGISLAIYIFIRFGTGHAYIQKFTTIVPVPITDLSFGERLLNIPAIIFYYIKTVIFPIQLIIAQKWVVTTLTLQSFYFPLFFDVIFFSFLTLGGIYIRKKRNDFFLLYVFFSVWFLSGLFMTLQIFPLDMTVAERWFYFPLAGLLGMIGVLVHTFLQEVSKNNLLLKRKIIKPISILLIVSIITLLSIRTIVRNTNYYNEFTLYAHDTQIQDNAVLEDVLANIYAQQGDTQKAFMHLQKSIQLTPFTHNLFHMGNYYEAQGDLKKAQEYYIKALIVAEEYYKTADPDRRKKEGNVEMYERLSNILLLQGEYTLTVKIASNGLRYYESSSILWRNLAISSNKVKDHVTALHAINKTKALGTNDLVDLLFNTISNKNEVPSLIIPMVIEEQKINLH